MSLTLPGASYGGSGSAPVGGSRSEDAAKNDHLSALRDLLFPVSEVTQLHSLVVAAVLVLDAVLVLLLPPSSSGLRSTGPAVYLLLPSAAALYMSLVLVSTEAAHRTLGSKTKARVLSAVSLTWALGLVGLIALSGGTFEPLRGIASSPGLFPACLAGIALPIASLWHGRLFDPERRRVGLYAACFPPLLALAILLPGLSSELTVSFTSATLLVSAVLFQISGSYRNGSTPSRAVPSRSSAPPNRLTFRLPRWAYPRSHFHRKPSTWPGAPPPTALGPRDLGSSASPPAGVSTGRWPNVVSTGFDWLDELFLGGFPRRGQLALVAEAGLGNETVVWGTLTEGLRRGESIVIVTASLSVREIAERMERFGPGFTDYDRQGKVLWVDASGRGSPLRSDPAALLGPGDSVRTLGALLAAAKEAERQSSRGFCLAFLGLTSVVDAVGDATGLAVFQNMVAILRERPALAMFTIELRDRSRPVVQRILDAFDGVLLFRSSDGRPFVKAFRLGPVETRAWVPCRFEDRRTDRLPRPARGGPGTTDPKSAELPPPVGQVGS